MNMTLVLIVVPQVAAFLLCFLYLIYKSAQKKSSPLLTLAGILFFVGATTAGTYFLADIRTTRLGYKEWRLERQFFFRIFTDRLSASGNLKATAKYMQSQEVKEKTLRYIREIVQPCRPKMIRFLSAGGLILLLAAVSLRIRKIAVTKWYPYVLVLFVLAGGALFDAGFYFWRYSAGTERTLEHNLRTQQVFLMRDMDALQTDLSIPDIVKITTREASKHRYGDGQGLLDALQKKKKPKLRDDL